MTGRKRCLACGSVECLHAECMADEFDVVTLPDGRISINGQAHLPPATAREQTRGLPQTVPCPYCGAAVGEPCQTWRRRCHYVYLSAIPGDPMKNGYRSWKTRLLWMRGPKRLWVRSHEWKYDEQGRPYNGDLTRLASWVLR